jgi:hypothetical protein
MATTVTGLTKDRMITMENATVISGNVVGDILHLHTRGGSDISAGNVRGPVGPAGSGHIICTSTTRPAMVVGDHGTTIYETDTALTRTWTGTRWRLQEYVICTSTTRPSGLGVSDEGTLIYETNTNFLYKWSGSAWNILPKSICTSTTRPSGLTTTDEGAQIYETDTNLVRTWIGSAWQLQGRFTCTSTTRPTALTSTDEGFTIYETDTNLEYYWSGSAWVLSKTGQERILHEIIRTTNSGSIGTTEIEIPGYSRTFTVVSGRKYTVKFGCRIDASANDLSLVIKVGDDIPTSSPNLYGEAHFTIRLAAYAERCEFMFPMGLPTGSQTLHLSAHVDVGTPGTFLMSAGPDYPGYYQILERF